MLKEFKEFAVKGNVIDMAVGIIIGGAFSTVVKSMVDDVLMPPIGLLIGEVDFTDLFLVLKPGSQAVSTLAEAKAAGAVTLNYGQFITSGISFLIMAFAVFLLVKSINRLRSLELALDPTPAPPPPEPTTQDCPWCLSEVPKKAKRCRACTADLTALA